MEENYYDLWLKALNGIVDTVQKGLDVAPQYIVDLVNRYWWYAFASWLVFTGVGAIIIYLGYRLYKRGKTLYDDDDSVGWIAAWFVVIWIWIMMICFNLDSAFMGLFLPEVSLIDHFTPNCSR